MRVALVAGPDPGHVFPVVALALRLQAAGDEPVVLTGSRWVHRIRAAGLACEELPGLAVAPGELDTDAGARVHARAAAMTGPVAARLASLRPDLVVADVITACGGLAAERLNLPWIELSPHPLYLPSRGLPPIGSGLAPGRGPHGRLRDHLLRGLTARSIRAGHAHRRAARASIGLPEHDPGPPVRMVATLPALEVPRPDWPAETHLVRPLQWDPATVELAPPPGNAPLVLVSPSTTTGGTLGVLEAALAGLRGVRVAATLLGEQRHDLPAWAVAGPGRQDPLLAQAELVVCGGGHGMLAKSLAVGVPVVLVPGGGDQRELAGRAERQGSAVVVRPLSVDALAAAVHVALGNPDLHAAAQRAAASATEVRTDPVQLCHRSAR